MITHCMWISWPYQLELGNEAEQPTASGQKPEAVNLHSYVRYDIHIGVGWQLCVA